MGRKKPAPGQCRCGGECGLEPHCRGLSVVCYQAARRKVADGTTTWEQLVQEGLALPKKYTNETRQAPITKKIEALVASR